jgi:DNA-binding XRE family transcriptional regulator
MPAREWTIPEVAAEQDVAQTEADKALEQLETAAELGVAIKAGVSAVCYTLQELSLEIRLARLSHLQIEKAKAAGTPPPA